MITPNQAKRMISELEAIEAMGRELAERAYKAKKQLERFHAPAPKGGKALSKAQVVNLIGNRRKAINKTATAGTVAV